MDQMVHIHRFVVLQKNFVKSQAKNQIQVILRILVILEMLRGNLDES